MARKPPLSIIPHRNRPDLDVPIAMKTVRQLLGFLVIHLYPKQRAAGTRVIFTDLDADRAACTARLEQAFEVMISARRRYQLLRARVCYVVVWVGDYCFADGFGGVHLPAEDIMGVTVHALASVLVHEAVHIRISGMGIRYKPEYRERIEKLCIREQATFLRCAPGNADDAEAMARAAESVLEFPWWTENERESNRQRVLDVNEVPQWLRSVVRGSSRRS